VFSSLFCSPIRFFPPQIVFPPPNLRFLPQPFVSLFFLYFRSVCFYVFISLQQHRIGFPWVVQPHCFSIRIKSRSNPFFIPSHHSPASFFFTMSKQIPFLSIPVVFPRFCVQKTRSFGIVPPGVYTFANPFFPRKSFPLLSNPSRVFPFPLVLFASSVPAKSFFGLFFRAPFIVLGSVVFFFQKSGFF